LYSAVEMYEPNKPGLASFHFYSKAPATQRLIKTKLGLMLLPRKRRPRDPRPLACNATTIY